MSHLDAYYLLLKKDSQPCNFEMIRAGAAAQSPVVGFAHH